MSIAVEKRPIEKAAQEAIRVLRDRAARPIEQAIRALENVAAINPHDPETEKLCAAQLGQIADAFRGQDSAALRSNYANSKKNLRRIALANLRHGSRRNNGGLSN